MGGLTERGILSKAELYDLATNQWGTMPWKLPRPLYGFSAQCIDGVLFIFGGMLASGPTAKCWSMDLNAPVLVWSQLPSLPIPLYGLASVQL